MNLTDEKYSGAQYHSVPCSKCWSRRTERTGPGDYKCRTCQRPGRLGISFPTSGARVRVEVR